MFIGNDGYDQAVFIQALGDVAPNTVCITAENAYEALTVLVEGNIMPGYIFVELNMPGMSGIEFLKTIKGIPALRDIQVIVHSTSPQPNKVIELKELGALAIYFRPYEYAGICNMLSLYFVDEMGVIKQN